MSGVDPLAAFIGGGGDVGALIDNELAQLAADAKALAGLLVEGVVVNARVLPSNGLSDLLEIAGRRVAASLPTTVRPGDVLQVKVTGFDGGRILLQIVATGADAAVEPGPPNVPLARDRAAFVAASIRPSPATAAPANQSVLGGVVRGAAAPAPAPAAPAGAAPVDELPPLAVPPNRPGITTDFTSAVSRANVAPPPAGEVRTVVEAAAPGAPRNAVVSPAEPTSIEARVAASRATAAQPGAPPSSVADLSSTAARAAQPFVAPPQIAPKPPANAPQADAAQPNALPPNISPAAARATGLAAYAQPVTLLRALRLPVTPGTVASATLALQRPDRLPVALAALEAALPAAGGDANIATLRTLLAFVGRIDPRSPALATQIAAYVEHVVDGPEPKLATLLAASREIAAAGGRAQPPNTADIGGASQGPQSPPPPPLPAAVAAERSAALSADLKQTLLAVAADPATPAALAPSLANALTALTAVQVHAAQALAAHPDGLAFSIPLTTQHGPANAQITVQRDAPQGRGVRLDGENFRIAFVLDTAHYGTVAIDLVTVGRDVTVDVRTGSAPAMRAFRDQLGALTARLESLRYRVASAGASLGMMPVVAAEAPPAPPADPDATVDRSA
ncbi:MAG TPA: hypothetical protein VGC72_17180 [Candidatus Elarobacter sp.]|jgi:hypothetical protein